MRAQRLLLPLFLASSLFATSAAEKFVHSYAITGKESGEELLKAAANVIPSARQMAYHEEEFIGFIHFGPNTFSGKEWGNGMEDPKLFNPSEVDTDNWCQVMKAAGMTKVIITVKHHDGYCTWQTRYNDKFSVKASPWKNGEGDVLKQLAVSAKKYGLKLGVYLSPADLYQIENKDGLYGNLSKKQKSIIPTDPKYFQSNPAKQRKVASDAPTFEVVADDYNRYFMNQLYELLTEYGEIHEVWFDGAHPKRKGGQTYMKPEWFKIIRQLAPNAVIFGGPDIRWCGNEHGGTRKNEWNVLPIADLTTLSGLDRRDQDLGTDELIIKSEFTVYGKTHKVNFLAYTISEVDTSIRAGWFWRNDTEQNVRSADEVYDIYERSVGGNAVLLLNIPPNKFGKFSDRDTECLLEVGRRAKATYGTNLLEGAKLSEDKLDDSDIETFWQLADTKGELTITLPKAQTINRFGLQEAISKVGQRVKSHAVDAWIDGEWKEVSTEGVIGYKRIHRFPAVTTDKFRVRILDSRFAPALAECSAHFYQAPPLAVSVKKSNGKVELATGNASGHHGAASAAQEIRFTLDGSEPTQSSKLYTEALDLPNGGIITARSFVGNAAGSVTQTRVGISTKGWKVKTSSHQPGYEAEKAIDGDSNTYWHTSWAKEVPVHPHTLTIELPKEQVINGFTYLPRQDRRVPDSMVEAWKVEVSLNGKSWKVAAQGEFGNLLNDPTQRTSLFKRKARVKYFRFTSLRGAQDKPYAGAAEIELLAE